MLWVTNFFCSFEMIILKKIKKGKQMLGKYLGIYIYGLSYTRVMYVFLLIHIHLAYMYIRTYAFTLKLSFPLSHFLFKICKPSLAVVFALARFDAAPWWCFTFLFALPISPRLTTIRRPEITHCSIMVRQ